MTPNAVQQELEQFRGAVNRILGLQFDDTKLGFLADVLRRRVKEDGGGEIDYLNRLEAAPSRKEVAALAQELTVPESYFFRNIDQFNAFAEIALPERLRARAGQNRLRILSVGCASGEEPYSLAILVRQLIDSQWNVSIDAVDINSAVLEKAKRARYTSWALRETPPEIQHRWFQANGAEFALDETIRSAVIFWERNLAEGDNGTWPPGMYDVVFCRNVLMYLTPGVAQAVVAGIARDLAPGGFLFLGHAETLRGLSQEFWLRHTHGTFYYQRKAEPDERAPRAHPDILPSRITAPSLSSAVESSESWMEAIGNATERIRALTHQALDAADRNPPNARPTWHTGAALGLLQREEFDEALELVEAFPPDSAQDPDVLLLRAVLLAHGGKLAESESVCERLLTLDAMNAGAHYVLALCRECGGDRWGAVDHDQVAVYLDPSFAMPRLHLGLLARKRGDFVTARRELEQAITLLKREDASRLLMFSGGFSRDALVAMCAAESALCGGNA